MVGAIDDEHPDAGFICPSVHQPTSLLFLVRTDPAQLALRLSSVSPGKNGQVAPGNRREFAKFGIAILLRVEH
jgi:hypothetical protein